MFFSTKSPRHWIPAWRRRCTIIWSHATCRSSELVIESLYASTISANSNCTQTGSQFREYSTANRHGLISGRKGSLFSVDAMIFFPTLFTNKDVCCLSIDACSRASRQPTDSCLSFVRHTCRGLPSKPYILFFACSCPSNERKRMNDCATCLSPLLPSELPRPHFSPALGEREKETDNGNVRLPQPLMTLPLCTKLTFLESIVSDSTRRIRTPPTTNMTMESKLPNDVDVATTEPSAPISLTTTNRRFKTNESKPSSWPTAHRSYKTTKKRTSAFRSSGGNTFSQSGM